MFLVKLHNNYMILSPKTLNCKGQLISLESPLIMGIINITQDSFYKDSRIQDTSSLKLKVSKMVEEGVDILDLGATSSRPGSTISTPNDEIEKLLPAIDLVLTEFPHMIISIDTIHSQVADTCLKSGAHIINDITAGTYDKYMMETVASHAAPYVMMHMKGLPSTMQDNPQYDDVVMDVLKFLKDRLNAALSSGIKDIIIDPGFGFGKTIKNNYELLQQLEIFNLLDCPILVGLSRKSMIYKALEISPEEALNGTTALNMIALMKGSHILRVHDVKEAKETIKLFKQLKF